MSSLAGDQPNVGRFSAKRSSNRPSGLPQTANRVGSLVTPILQRSCRCSRLPRCNLPSRRARATRSLPRGFLSSILLTGIAPDERWSGSIFGAAAVPAVACSEIAATARRFCHRRRAVVLGFGSRSSHCLCPLALCGVVGSAAREAAEAGSWVSVRRQLFSPGGLYAAQSGGIRRPDIHASAIAPRCRGFGAPRASVGGPRAG